jgi:hypothetical protein
MEGKNETSAGRSCFGNKNDGEMVDWNVLGMGRHEKYAEQWCFSIGKKNERLLVFQQREKLLLMVFQQWKGKMKQVLDGVVSGIRMMGKWWTGMFWE